VDNTVIIEEFETPIGLFGAVITAKGLSRLTFPTEPFSSCSEWVKRWEPQAVQIKDEARLRPLVEQLTAYFEGTLHNFDIPLDMRGTTFQLEVWAALLNIAYGEIRSYMQIANLLGNPLAVRAVGTANGSNPVPIIVPCHRVIGSNGNLIGYGGGLDLKKKLLQLEGALMF
jgi:O-6-methylguanine DNA methyltransferase